MPTSKVKLWANTSGEAVASSVVGQQVCAQTKELQPLQSHSDTVSVYACVC